ncbi:hypothetical protein Mapa_005164 [Marchantia paleacea]|nr:hypothetical protein Mapa_005164 [Marchantia paleacea]
MVVKPDVAKYMEDRAREYQQRQMPAVFAAALIILTWLMWVHRHSQRDHKGPKKWPFIGCIIEQARNFDRLHDWLFDYFKSGCLTYSVPMISINNTFTADPRNVEHILKNNFNNYPKGELIKERFGDMLGHGIFNVDGDMWRHQRKVATLEFASSKLRDFSIHAFRTEALKLVQVLAIAAKNGQSVDLQDLFMRLTLDSICKVGFGVDIGSLSPMLPAIPFANAFDEANRLIVRRYIDMFWKLKRTLNIGGEGKLKKCINVVNSFIYKVIETRRAEMSAASTLDQDKQQHSGVDILSRFMSITDGDQTYSDERLRDVVINFIIAGRDTTAITLSWFFFELCRNPHVVDKILEEVSTVLELDPQADLDLSNSRDAAGFGDRILEFAQLLTYQSLSKMHYLHGALTEALRLYPAVPLETKVAAANDVFPDGTPIKRGEFVSYASYAMGRLKCLWGPDVDEFKPERWLKNGVFQPQSPFKLTAFQAGPRMCLGKDSSYLQMKLTTVILLMFFKFQLQRNEVPNYSLMVVLYIANGLPVNVLQRNGSDTK